MHYFEIRVTDVEIGEDSEDRRTREVEDAQRLAFRPVVEDITQAFQQSLDARLKDLFDAFNSAVDSRPRGLQSAHESGGFGLTEPIRDNAKDRATPSLIEGPASGKAADRRNLRVAAVGVAGNPSIQQDVIGGEEVPAAPRLT